MSELSSSGFSYDAYTTVSNDTAQLFVDVPSLWGEVNGSDWVVDAEKVGLTVSASANLDSYNNTWTEPGVFLGVSRTLAQRMTSEQLLDTIQFSDYCYYAGRRVYEGERYAGVYDKWVDCDEEKVIFLVFSMRPPDNSFLVVLQFQATSQPDSRALERALTTFHTTGTLD